MRALRKPKELVVTFRKDRGYWTWLWFDDKGTRHGERLGTKAELPDRVDALKKAHEVKRQLEEPKAPSLTVKLIVEEYVESDEYLEKRKSSRRTWGAWFRLYIIPQWGAEPMIHLRPKPVTKWLKTLKLGPGSKRQIVSQLYALYKYAMWADYIPHEVNPMSTVTVPGATVAMKTRMELKFHEFECWILSLPEPYYSIAVVQLGCGLRVSEALGFRWLDVDWQDRTIMLERGFVEGEMNKPKTKKSLKRLHLSPVVYRTLENWRKQSPFPADGDWIFASPVKLGGCPIVRQTVDRMYRKAATERGLSRFGTHILRHATRSWLDALNVKATVQREMMRHERLDQTMRYGGVVTDEEREAWDDLGRMIDTALIPEQANLFKPQ